MDGTTHYTEYAAAYARGRLQLRADTSDEDALEQARRCGLRLHRFKRTALLPRVRRVLGILRGWRPRHVVDVGSGRGAFLWPFLEAFTNARVTCLEVSDERFRQLDAVRRGGLARLSAARMDAMDVTLSDRSACGVTLLEVLEHMPAPERAAAHALRVAREVVVATVPSKPDDNPEHIQLFTALSLRQLFIDAGARSVRIDAVPGHFVAVVRSA